jgi:hypothetical protein
MTTSRIVTVAAAAVLAGALTAHAQQVSEKTNRDRKLITTEEIEAARVNTAYQVVEKLHPEYLRRVNRVHSLGAGGSVRGSRASGTGASSGAGMASVEDAYSRPQDEQRTTAVFVDGTDMGGIDELQRIQSNLIEEIRYLTGPDAGAKYGPRFSAGVIELKLRNH